MLTLSEVAAHFHEARREGTGYRAECPVHHGKSLIIWQGDTSICLQCKARGCPFEEIIAAAGLRQGDVSPDTRVLRSEFIREHVYWNASNTTPLYRKVKKRLPPGSKENPYLLQRPGGNGSGWLNGIQGVERVLYRLPELKGQTRVWIPEGEKDVDYLWSLGFPATCNAFGAGKWTDADSLAVKAQGAIEVILLQDNDGAGLEHVQKEALSFGRVGGVMVITLPPFPDVPTKGDVSDWLDKGHTRDELEALVAAQAPVIVVPMLDPAFLSDAVHVIAEGQRIAEEGIPYTVAEMIPAYGMLGFLVAFAKVGKTTIGQALAAAVAMGRPFLERETKRARVLIIAAEDPPEYTAYLARTLQVDEGWLTFYRAPIQLNADGLARIIHALQDGGYGLLLIASWQAVVRGLVKDENDNAGGVNVVENVKIATRTTAIPWLVDAHAGKGEDQADDADPSMALRGASAMAAAADYSLSLRYANGTFGNRRRLSGKGRFVNFSPLTLEYDLDTSLYTCLGDTNKAKVETTWRLVLETGALTNTPQSLSEIAIRAGLVPEGIKPNKTHRDRIRDALKGRDTVGQTDTLRRGQKTALFHLLEVF